jgi:hypothetical protein
VYRRHLASCTCLPDELGSSDQFPSSERRSSSTARQGDGEEMAGLVVMFVLVVRLMTIVPVTSVTFLRGTLVIGTSGSCVLLRGRRGRRAVFRIGLFSPKMTPLDSCENGCCRQPLVSSVPFHRRCIVLTLRIATIVIVRPQPIDLATGKTSAEAPAEKRYLITAISQRFCASSTHNYSQRSLPRFWSACNQPSWISACLLLQLARSRHVLGVQRGENEHECCC